MHETALAVFAFFDDLILGPLEVRQPRPMTFALVAGDLVNARWDVSADMVNTISETCQIKTVALANSALISEVLR